MRSSTHPDLEYVVEADGAERAHASFDDALSYAFSAALAAGAARIDVLVYSDEGAHAFGGASAVERYRDDPDASVFQRFEIEVRDIGHSR